MTTPSSPPRGPAGVGRRAGAILGSPGRYRALIALACLGGALIGALDQLRKDSLYEATAQVIVRGTDVSSRRSSGDQNTNRLVTTLAELVRSPEVLDEAASRGRLDAAGRRTLDTNTSVATKIDSDVIDISTRWVSEDDAVRLANAVAQSFVAYRRQIDVGPLIAAEADLTRTITRLERSGGGGGSTLQSLIAARVDLQTDIQLGGRNSIIAQADEAPKVAPRPKLWAAIGGLLGLGAGVLAVLLLGRLSGGRARSAEELATSLGLPVLARVPHLPISSAPGAGALALQPSPPPEADAFWTLLASLDLLDPERRNRVVLIVSPTAGEGASTIATNLAAAEARAGRSVALCDFDLRRPSLARVFGYSPYQEGVTSVLTGRSGLDEALERVPVTPLTPAPAVPGRSPAATGGLVLLTSGPPVASAGGLTSSAAVAPLISGLRNSASRVYIDSPPWLASGDALALSRHADAIVLVTRSGAAPGAHFDEMGTWFEQIATPVVGIVLNDPQAETPQTAPPATDDSRGEPALT